MNSNSSNQFQELFYIFRQRTWLDRVLAVIAAAALVVLAFLFVTVFVLVGGAVALLLYARWRWLARRLRGRQLNRVIEGEYIEIEEDRIPDSTPTDGARARS